MKEYLINSGEFNIIVRPEQRQYFLLDDGPQSRSTVADFVAGTAVAYEALQPLWFKYAADETWHGFDAKERRLHEDISEPELIDRFVLKKFNFGSLVAVRDTDSGKVQVFKRDRLQP